MVDIPINDVTPRNRYVSTGGETTFDYDFPIFDPDHIRVQESDPLDLTNPVTLVRGVDYNVTGVGAETGGTIDLLVGAYPTGAIEDNIYTLTRVMPYERLNDYQFSGDFESSDVNNDFDVAIMLIQQLNRLLLGSARLDDTDELTSLPIKIESAAQRQGRVIGFNAAGTGLEAGPLFTDIDAIGDIIPEIIIVSDNIASVITTADDIANVNTVAGSIANVNSVAGSISNVNAVAGNATNINAVAGNATNINTVAGAIAAVNTVATNIASVNTVSTNIANVNLVAAIDGDVSTVASIGAAVVTVATINAAVSTVAGISANVTTVAGIAANVTTVAGIAANVTTVAGISAAVSTVAANIADIQNAEENANIAKAAGGFTYTYDTDTTNGNPGSGFLRFNNATLSSATALYISETTGLAQAIAAELATWDDSTSTIHGKLRMFKQSDPSTFVIFNVTGTLTDNGAWDTLTVGYVGGAGSFADNDVVTVQYLRTGDKGDIGPSGSVDFPALTAEASVALADYLVLNDVSEGATAVNKILVSDFIKFIGLVSTITLASGDSIPIWDTSASVTGRVTVQTLFDFINSLTAETAPATNDKVALYDTSASATDGITLDNLFKVIASLTSVTAPAIDDVLSIYDTSGAVAGRMRFDDFLKVTNGLTEDTAPDLYDDFTNTYDASAGTAKKVRPQAFIAGPFANQILNGLTTSNNAVDATNDINIAAGSCVSDDGTTVMTLSSSITKRLDAAWAVGSGNGGLDTGSIANDSYYIWVINRPDTGVTDVLFSASPTSPTMPTNYTKKKRIGAFVRASAAILPYTQRGKEFRLKTPVTDYANSTPGTSRVTVSMLSIPVDIVTNAIVRVRLADNGNYTYVSALTEVDLAPATTAAPLFNAGNGAINGSAELFVYTNSSGQISFRCTSNGRIDINAVGWIDFSI